MDKKIYFEPETSVLLFGLAQPLLTESDPYIGDDNQGSKGEGSADDF